MTMQQTTFRESEAFKMRVIRRGTKAVHFLHAVRTKDWHAGALLVKMTRVENSINVGPPRRRDLTVHQLVPIHGSKELTSLIFRGIFGATSKSTSRFLCQQSFQH